MRMGLARAAAALLVVTVATPAVGQGGKWTMSVARAESDAVAQPQLAGLFGTPPYPPDSRYSPPPAAGQPTLAEAPAASGAGQAIRVPSNPGLGGAISEVRGGVLYHDSGPISSHTEDGVDINLEVLFTSPQIFRYILSPRPHLGGSINTAGDTSQGYFGLSWTADIYENFFVEFSFGGSVHDGNLDDDEGDRNDLGCRILFRESISAGVILGGRHTISAMLDHISNAGLCSDNDGQDTAGIRYGYRF